MITAVADQLREERSPERISGFMTPLAGMGLSHQWIYSLIWLDGVHGGDLWQCLRYPKRRSKHRAHIKSAGFGKVLDRVGIGHRPVEVDDRLTIGHWEGDTLLKVYKQSGLVTPVERRSGYLLAARLPRIRAELTKAAMIRLLTPRREAVRTIMRDNGPEFPSHEEVAAAVCFCDPYCSGQRGTIVDTNGLIRQYFPKGTDFRLVTDTEVRRVVKKLNHRPRNRFGYRTPAQVLLRECSGTLDTANAALIA